jgi:hypothetical protein
MNPEVKSPEMKYKNKVIPKLDGAQQIILGGKPTDISNRSICLLHKMDGEFDHSQPLDKTHEKFGYSLWYLQETDEGEKVYLWPYRGEDSDALIIEIMKDFLDVTLDLKNELLQKCIESAVDAFREKGWNESK